MEMQNKLKQSLQTKFDTCIEKYMESLLKYEAKQIEIIKQVDPTFEGDIRSFFRQHTIVSESIDNSKKHYSFNEKKYINYDYIADNIGYIFDDIGKNVRKKVEFTKEYLEFRFYAKIIENLTLVLNKAFSKQILDEYSYSEEDKTNQKNIK